MAIEIGLLLYPRLTQLDLTAPYELFHRVPDSRVHLVWKDTAPVHSDSGLGLLPTTTLADCPQLDVLCVPGGFGQRTVGNDAVVLDWLREQGKHARYVTSVCTGSLLLGAAGLLEGYAATTHWAYTDFLAGFGARYQKGRVVVDRNRITAGGVTAGLDFGLRIVSELAGEDVAKMLQLRIEYDPDPPFRSGHPDVADPALVAEARRQIAVRMAKDA
jgi:cyclohexyl-isocyanide hydratase